MYYAQNNYPGVKLGTSSDSIKQDGCALVAYSNIAGIDPVTLNQQFIAANDYASGELIEWGNCAKTAGLRYLGKAASPTVYPCIGETDHFKSIGYPSHYFAIISPTQIVDSLDGKVKPISTYHIVGVQNVTTQPTTSPSNPPSTNTMTPDQDFSNCWITVATAWPTQADIDAWHAAGSPPAYTYVQQHAPNPIGDQLSSVSTDNATLTKNLSDVTDNANMLAQQLSDANAQITKLKATPAASTTPATSGTTPGYLTSEFAGTVFVHLLAALTMIAGLNATGNQYVNYAITGAGTVIALLNQLGYTSSRTAIKVAASK